MSSSPNAKLSLTQLITLACLAEVIASKPGNVHRGADFDETTFGDFAVSAVVAADALAAAPLGVGAAVLAAVERTQHFVGQNTNLGIILLLAPLAAVPRTQKCESGIAAALTQLGADDARQVYRAISIATAGHLGNTDKWDVHDNEIPPSLHDAMEHAADRDRVARQYVTDFQDVMAIVSWLKELPGARLSEKIVRGHVRAMAHWPDTLIARKCGWEVAQQSQGYAQLAEDRAAANDDDGFWQMVGELDFWLRSDGHRRNPGTTADLVCAATFVLLRDHDVSPLL